MSALAKFFVVYHKSMSLELSTVVEGTRPVLQPEDVAFTGRAAVSPALQEEAVTSASTGGLPLRELVRVDDDTVGFVTWNDVLDYLERIRDGESIAAGSCSGCGACGGCDARPRHQ